MRTSLWLPAIAGGVLLAAPALAQNYPSQYAPQQYAPQQYAPQQVEPPSRYAPAQPPSAMPQPPSRYAPGQQGYAPDQQGYAPPSDMPPRRYSRSPRARDPRGPDAVSEMERERYNPGVPSVPFQNRDGAVADQMGGAGVQDWLMQARAAIARGNLGQANEFLERAETRMLSRSTAPERAGEPASGPRLNSIAGARQALRNRDRGGAMQQIDQALGGG